MGAFAWVTLATNDSYSLGALVLAHSLKQAGTVHQLAVLVTPGVTPAMREKLANVFNIVQEVNILDSRDEANLKLLKRPELGITFTKLHCWRLTQFEKCVFLDADTLVLQNADELFEREELSAAPDVGWPDCFNSGVFVYRPALGTFEKLVQFALEKGSFDGGDQGLLNLYFSDWAHKDISKHLPFIYNMCSTACYSYLPAFKQFGANAKIMHFIGAQKPWLQYFNTETRKVQPSGDSTHLREVLQRWWDIFCSLIHPHLSPAMPDQSQHGISPSYFPPQYDPSPNPVASADYYDNAWDPWDEYDKKIAQNSHYVSTPTHFSQNQPTKSQNTNASSVANQPTINHSQPQMQNDNTLSIQNNSYYQPPAPQAIYHTPRVPTRLTPPPEEPHNQQQYHNHSEPHHCHQSDQQYYHHPEPQYHNHHEHQSESESQPSKHDIEPQYYQEQHHDRHPNQDQLQYNENCEVTKSYNHNRVPEHSRSPPPNPDPILPKECKPTSAGSNVCLSSTIEDNSKQEDAGLAAAFSQLTLGVPRTTEQDALENVLRKQAWEVGNIDYLGKDSFDKIWEKISETLSTESSAGPPPPEPESAPVKSQSQTAQQEQAIPPAVSPSEILTEKSSLDSPKVDSSESGSPVEVKQEPQISPATELAQTPISPEQPITETVISTDKSVAPPEPIKTPESPVKEDIASAVLKPEPDAKAPSQVEEKIKAEPVTDLAPEAPKPAAVEEEPKVVQEPTPVTSVPESPAESKPELVKEESLVPQVQPVAEEAAADKILETGKPEEQPKTTETQSEPKQAPIVGEQIASEPKSELAQVPIEVVSEPICPLLPKKDAPQPPKETAVSAEVKQPPQEPKETEPQSAPDSKEAASTESPKSESSATAAVSSVKTPEGLTPSEASAVAAPELDISKAAASPKTKLTEPTPPSTPSSPPLEKTKQALSAEVSVPETPPPSEGGSTPTPPPRKTDKPKKAAAKPKK